MYMPSLFSCVRLTVTLWTVARQALCPWDSPGKNTGVDCHALFQERIKLAQLGLALSLGPIN